MLLRKEIPDRMGLNEHFWPFIRENAWDEQGFTGSGGDFVSHFNLDLRSVSWFGAPGPRKDLEKVVEESDDWVVRQDAWGASLKLWKRKAGTPEHVGFSMTSPQIWQDEYRDAFKSMDVRDGMKIGEIKDNYRKAMAGEEFVTYSSLFVFEELRHILGDGTMLEALLLEPEWVHDFNSLMTQKYIEWYEMLFRDVGLPDGVHIYEDLGYTASAFASPACHRELILPYHKKLFRLFKDHGLPIILHTCGDFRPHMESIVESGVDCIQALEAKTGMNVVELAKSYKNKICFMGNIDIRALESGDRGRIREECVGKIEGMKQLRAPYVFMSDHSIPPTVKLKDYEYMLGLFQENCRY